MKRFNEGFNNAGPTPASKRARVGPDDVEIRILIPSKVAGSIIGKGGANIARLRADYAAKVTVPDCPGPERILTVISGFDSAFNVINDVLPNLENTTGSSRRKNDKRREQAEKEEKRIKEKKERDAMRAAKMMTKALKKSPWMTEEILKLTETKKKLHERSKVDSSYHEEFVKVSKMVQKEVRSARKKYYGALVDSIENIEGNASPSETNVDEDEHSSFENDEGDDSIGAGGDHQDTVDDVDIRLLVHQSQAGCVIGKGGGKVKELREKTGSRIKIYSNCCPDSTDRVVQLTGPGLNAVDCMKEILDLIKTAPIKGPDNQYDPNHFDDYYAEEYGGFGGGSSAPNFGGMRGGPAGGRGPPGGGRFGGPPPPRGAPMGGPPGRGGFRGGYDDLMGGDDYGMHPGRAGIPPMGNGAGGGGAKTTTQVTIPKDLAGAIIGKQGNRIRKVRIESGAEITIDEPLAGSNDRIITINGLPNQIQMAQYLLQQCVHQNAKGAGSGSGGGSRRY